MSYDQMTLPCGLRIIGERMPHFRSVSVGLWVGSGSQYEYDNEGGLSHFIEHMVFKGTKTRSAKQIAIEMDAVGGQINAFTAKECTCFYVKVMDEHLPLAMDVVTELVIHPAFDPVEMEKEKGVVLDEIDMAEDTPEDLVHEMLMLAHYGDQNISRPILGTAEKVSAFTRADVEAYWRKMYRPCNAVLSVAGSYNWDEVVALAEKAAAAWTDEGYEKRTFKTVPAQPQIVAREKEIEQVHIAFGFPGLQIGADGIFEETLYSTVYGGAMSSRLFQRVREESGAAYTVYSCPNSYTDTGMMSVYAATSPENGLAVINMIREETEKLVRDGMTPEEFVMARDQLKASYVLGLESTSARMQSNGRRMLLRNSTRDPETILKMIEEMTIENSNALMREKLSARPSISLVGKDAEKLAAMLKEKE